MKINLQKLIGLVVISASLIAGCKKEDKAPSNYFKYDADKYSLTSGMLQYYGTPVEGTYYIDMVLFSSGFTLHQTGENLDSITGIGDAVSFEMYSSEQTVLAAGTYTYDSESTEAPGTFDFAESYINIDAQTGEGTTHELNAGTVTVSKTGSTYDISFDCTATTGKKVVGHYKGSLSYFVGQMGKKSGQVNMQKSKRGL